MTQGQELDPKKPGSAKDPKRGIWSAEELAAQAIANLAAVKGQRQAEIRAVKDGLAYLSDLVSGDGVLHGADHVEAKAACDAVTRFLARLVMTLAAVHPDEDYHVLCPIDPVPHPTTFHDLHTEAP